MTSDAIIRFSISLPQELLGSLDEKIAEHGYASRSEYVRDLIRGQIVEDLWSIPTEKVIGVLTLIYDHHQRELLQKIMDIQHNADAEILCSTHVHINHHNCIETVIIKGTPEQIENIANKIGGLKGINFSKLTKTATF